MNRGRFLHEHLVQTQRVYRAVSTQKCFKLNVLRNCSSGTVVDFVAVKTPSFNSFQHLRIFRC